MQSLWMLAASFFFSLMGLCIKLAFARHHLAEIIMFRGVPSVLLLTSFALWRGQSLLGTHLRTHAVRNVSGVASMWLGFYGMTHLPLGLATTLNYSSPLFIAAFLLYSGYYVGIWRDQWLRFAAIVLGFGGVMLLFNPWGETNLNRFAVALGLLGGALAAVAYMTVRSLGRLGEPEWRTVLLFSVSVIISGAVCMPWVGFSSQYTPTSVLQLAGVGLFGMVAQLCMTRAFGQGRASLSATLQYTTIVFAVLWGELFWQEHIDFSGFVGMFLIVLAGLGATWYALRHPVPSSPPN